MIATVCTIVALVSFILFIVLCIVGGSFWARNGGCE